MAVLLRDIDAVSLLVGDVVVELLSDTDAVSLLVVDGAGDDESVAAGESDLDGDRLLLRVRVVVGAFDRVTVGDVDAVDVVVVDVDGVELGVVVAVVVPVAEQVVSTGVFSTPAFTCRYAQSHTRLFSAR